MGMRDLVDELSAKRTRIRKMGGEEAVLRQHAAGKLTVRERLGLLFREESIMSGVVPQVAAMMGPGAAGTAYIPALADFVPMVRGTGNMALGGPPRLEAG